MNPLWIVVRKRNLGQLSLKLVLKNIPTVPNPSMKQYGFLWTLSSLNVTTQYLDWSCWRGSGQISWVCENGPSCWLDFPRRAQLTEPGWCNQFPPPGPRERRLDWWCWPPGWIAACGHPASWDWKRDTEQNGAMTGYMDSLVIEQP